MTVLDARVGFREYLVYWAGTLPVRVFGAGAVVLAWRPWATMSGVPASVGLGCAVVFALWAAPPLDRRPTLESARWSYLVPRYRTTVLAGGVVVIAAFGEPAWWERACVAGLLVAYLVTSETWPWRWGRGAARVCAEAIAAGAGAGVVLAAAAVPVTGPGAGMGRVIAAGVVMGLMVVGGGVVGARWRRSLHE
ncbi:hypothetical protein H0H10_22075 [Streptomyces sp. TRM S81-3]|uniref:Uncharacterized protein n=1 Tax=Streptomyces griseicoloratus TaxID=2752516 RepID=A0A926QRF5_9ACTN|nr:hypothetical protein [Streptomyces griseicoloratus]MBD0421809.1 hypothetical protein [Streptomyces griseicoloratus]